MCPGRSLLATNIHQQLLQREKRKKHWANETPARQPAPRNIRARFVTHPLTCWYRSLIMIQPIVHLVARKRRVCHSACEPRFIT